ncbi:hypothetical protein LR48_Vigan01g177600 [Vigna angularis]|uniref:Aminotransferase-like plant mobile domain-containing protein n=1 Tax=Phaseolus angularis TaxID=3914 RepID=A0A0L9TNU0_PHAAN|nr:hypothetical protein LR48_Vigan01g177600 [Vigna angularis]
MRRCDATVRRWCDGEVWWCFLPQASARRRHAAPIQDDPIAEDRAFEEEAYQAYEGPVHEEAFEAPHDDNEEEEHVNVPDIQEEDVDGFPGGPRDASLLTHYVQHVAYGISQGRNWIYEHFPTMGRRRLVSSYDETTPRAARWQSPRQSSTLAEIRSQLDGLTYSGVVWHPYEGRRGICPFFGICMYSGWIRIGDILSRYLPERVI